MVASETGRPVSRATTDPATVPVLDCAAASCEATARRIRGSKGKMRIERPE
jgi:hypothetical protein